MKQKTVCHSIVKINFLIPVLFKSLLILVFGILAESVQAQGCSIILKINNPAPVCSPSTVDLTSDAITSGSTGGLKFNYYLNTELTLQVPSPTNVSAGTYYIKGILNGYCAGFAVVAVTVTVLEKPRLMIPDPVIKRGGANVDLTISQVTAGSDSGLTFSYWDDAALMKPFPSPQSAGVGTYFIKGTSVNGCFDYKSITVNDL